MNYIVFDIETYHPDRLDKMDVKAFKTSVTGAYLSWTNEYIAILEPDIQDFLELCKEADLLVGYNHIWFDLKVLQKYSEYDLLRLPSYDILLEIEKKIGFKPKLDDICKATLGTQKTDTYDQFKNYYWDDNWLPLIDYCMHDVRLTKELFDLVLANKPLKYLDLLESKEVLLDPPSSGRVEFEPQVESVF